MSQRNSNTTIDLDNNEIHMMVTCISQFIQYLMIIHRWISQTMELALQLKFPYNIIKSAKDKNDI